MRGIWNRSVPYDPQNKIIKKLLQCYAVTRCCLPLWTQTIYKNSYKCAQNVILIGVCFSCFFSLNHSYINRQLMQQWLVLSITRRDRKQTSYYRKAIFLLYWSEGKLMGADFNCTTTYSPFMGLLYIKCYDHFQQTIYTRDSWSSFWYTPI